MILTAFSFIEPGTQSVSGQAGVGIFSEGLEPHRPRFTNSAPVRKRVPRLERRYRKEQAVPVARSKTGSFTLAVDLVTEVVDPVFFFLINGSNLEFDFVDCHIFFHSLFPDIAEKYAFHKR